MKGFGIDQFELMLMPILKTYRKVAKDWVDKYIEEKGDIEESVATVQHELAEFRFHFKKIVKEFADKVIEENGYEGESAPVYELAQNYVDIEVNETVVKVFKVRTKILTDKLLDKLLKNETVTEDTILQVRKCLITCVETDTVTAKSIIAAMTIWCASHADENFEMVEKIMLNGKEEMNSKTVINADDGESFLGSPLHAAVLFKSTDLLKLLMNFEDVDVSLQFGTYENQENAGNLLDLAFQIGNHEIISCVLENVKCSELVIIENGIPLCLANAVSIGDNDIVELLISKESFHPSLNPLMCLMLAIQDNNLGIFTKFLPNAKATLNTPIPNLSSPCIQCSAPATTLLHLAICSYRPRMVKLLVQAGCDVNSTQGHLEGYTPLMQAIAMAENHNCQRVCEDRVISELLCAEQINLDLVGGEGKMTAQDLLTSNTCHSIRKMVEQACMRSKFKKKLQLRQERQRKAAESSVGKSKRERICWFCSSTQQLLRCAGCRVAWYCGEECQGEDWEVHGDWCMERGRRRKVKHENDHPCD